MACAAALVPTFDAVAPQDFFKLSKDEKPESVKLSPGDDFHFIFLVDRSGSMGMFGRMKIAREALTLFMRSLPENSTFSIVSFGTDFAYLGGKPFQTYNDASKNDAIKQIEGFDSNFGGTDIYRPLREA